MKVAVKQHFGCLHGGVKRSTAAITVLPVLCLYIDDLLLLPV